MKRNLLPILLPIRSIVFLLTFVACAWLVNTDLCRIGHWWSMIAVAVNILTILLLVFAAHKSGQTFWQLINYRKGQTNWKTILWVTLLVLVVGILCWYYYRKRNPLPIMVGHAIIDLATAAQIVATSVIPGLYETMCGM